MTDLENLTNEELHEELASYDGPEELWVEIGLRLGVDGIWGIRAAAAPDNPRTGHAAGRLRRYRKLWNGTPEAGSNGSE